MAASRWMGRGDKNGADGAAVDAMRIVLDTVPMDGVVVIGEGEKDEAPMLYNGEKVGDGTAGRHRHRRRPDRRHHAHRAGPGQRHGGDRRVRAGHDVRPGPLRLHGEDRRRPRGRAPSTSPLTPTENLQAVAKALGETVRDVTVVILDRDRHEELIAEVRAAGARIRLIPDGDVAGAISTAWPESGRRHPLRHRRHPRGGHRRRRPQVHGRRDPGPALAPQRRGAPGRHRRRLRPRQVLTTDDLVSGDNCFFAATGITDGELLKGVHYHRRGAPPVAGHAVQVGHRPPHQRQHKLKLANFARSTSPESPPAHARKQPMGWRCRRPAGGASRHGAGGGLAAFCRPDRSRPRTCRVGPASASAAQSSADCHGIPSRRGSTPARSWNSV